MTDDNIKQEENKPIPDMMLLMAKHQGYVPVDCYLNGFVVMAIINKGENPCIGCHLDRKICKSNIKDNIK